MQVKGTGIKTTRDFVKTNFESRFNEWLAVLPAESQRLYTGAIEVGGWFPIKSAYYDPIEKIVELFYFGNSQLAGDELGRYSADASLKGIYKVFLLVATPQYLMKRAAMMMQAFYNPSEVEVSYAIGKQVTFKIKKFDNISKTVEYRIAGWCQQALELRNCEQVSYNISEHLSLGQGETVIRLYWE